MDFVLLSKGKLIIKLFLLLNNFKLTSHPVVSVWIQNVSHDPRIRVYQQFQDPGEL